MIRIELNMNCQRVVYQNNQRLISQTEIISRNFSNPMACQANTIHWGCNVAQGQMAKFTFVINLGYWLSTNSNKHFPKRWLLGQRFSTCMILPLCVCCLYFRHNFASWSGYKNTYIYIYKYIDVVEPTQPWHAFQNVMASSYNTHNTHAPF